LLCFIGEYSQYIGNRSIRKKNHLILLLFFGVATAIFPQVKFLNSINIDDGLAYSQVLCAEIDKDGYMWFGTSSGLSRWDGNRFTNFYIQNGLPSNHIKELKWSDKFGLVLATQKGVAFYKDGKIITPENYPVELRTRINQVFINGDEVFIAASKAGLWTFYNNTFSQIKFTSGEQKFSPTSFLQQKNGAFLVGSADVGILEYKNGKLVNSEYDELKKFSITTLAENNSGDLFAGTEKNGVFVYQDSKILHFTVENGLPDDYVKHIHFGPDNTYYFATEEGIAIFSGGKIVDILDREDGLVTEFVWKIFFNEGIYYFMTDGSGFYQYVPNRFTYFDEESGLPNNTVWAISELKHGTICLATDNGISFIRKSKIKNEILNKVKKDDVITIFEDTDGTVYFGTNDHGVRILKNGVYKSINKSNGLTSKTVWSITDDKMGNLLFSTFDGGVCVFDGDKIIDTINVQDGMPNNFILASFTASDSVIYFSHDGAGITVYKDGNLNVCFEEMNECIIWDIYEDKFGNMIFGSDNKGIIIYYADGKKDTIDISSGLSNNSVVGIETDDSGRIYAITDRGLNIIERKNDKYFIRNILKEDGLPSNECNQNAIHKDSKGNIWIGTIKGVVKYSPEYDKPDLTPPKIIISSMKVFDDEVPLDREEKLSLAYNENYIKFEFTGIEFSAPHKLNYAYYLKGIDDEWNYGKRQYVQYTNLDDGEYSFYVKTSNEWGVWSEAKSISFSISQAYWETWWFYLIIALTIVSIFAAIILYRIKQLLAFERLRTKIAADLHDDIGSGLTEISFIGEMINFKLQPEVRSVISEELTKIGEVSRGLVDSMSDIVWLVNPSKDSLFDLFVRLGDAYKEICDSKNITLNLHNVDDLKKVNLKMEHRQNIYLIFKEAMNNSIKYSSCSQIDLFPNVLSSKLKLEFRDNGIGFEYDGKQSGNGLNNMQKRAEQIGGELEISSSPHNGTIITFLGKMS